MQVLLVCRPQTAFKDDLFPAQKTEKEILTARLNRIRRIKRQRRFLTLGWRHVRCFRRQPKRTAPKDFGQDVRPAGA